MTKYTEMQIFFLKEKNKMERSIREAPKYFVQPEFTPTNWGYEQIISKNLKQIFVKKGKSNEWQCNDSDAIIYVEKGKLHLLYNVENNIEGACEIVLSDGDAFKINASMYYKFDSLLDVSFMFLKGDK